MLNTRESRERPVVLAAAAHPDDIEFTMAGTLLRLGDIGAELHLWNLATGSCGTATQGRDEIVRIRQEEARESARIAAAAWHPPLVDDFQIFYEPRLLARVTAIVRRIRPTLMLIPSPEDYMEDHQNACRLLVTAAFVRGMRNFQTEPPIEPIDEDVTIYHAMPHGLCDGLRRLIRPGIYVDISPVIEQKTLMLACHRSQKDWLDKSQGMGSYINAMLDMGRELGRMSGRFEHAEGWRRRSHLGFGPEGYDPLKDLLGDACLIDPEYETGLE